MTFPRVIEPRHIEFETWHDVPRQPIFELSLPIENHKGIEIQLIGLVFKMLTMCGFCLYKTGENGAIALMFPLCPAKIICDSVIRQTCPTSDILIYKR